MAIDPKLVSIKTAAQLPSGIPTANGEFLYFEDETLMKAEMSDLYDRVESAYLGIITPSSTIPAGSWYGTVLAAGTFNNVTPAITVDAADFDEENGMPNNEVRIIISEGVATKDVRRVKGDVGDSAYEVAVANGFVGTEAEWLDSLVPSTIQRYEDAFAMLPSGIFEFIPREKTESFPSPTQSAYWWGDVDGKISGGTLRKIYIKGSQSGTVNIAFCEINGSTSTVLYNEDVTVPNAGLNIIDVSTMSVPEEILENSGVYVLAGNTAVNYATDSQINYAPVGTPKAVYITKSTGAVTYGNFDIAIYLEIEKDFELVARVKAIEADSSQGGETLISNYSDLVSAIATKDIIKLAPTTISIEATLVIPPGKTIIGCGTKTILEPIAGVNVALDLSNSNGVTLSNFVLKGKGANVVPTQTTVIDTTLDAISNTNIGTQVGVLLNKSDGSKISNVILKNFNNSGIQASYVGINGGFSHGVKIENCSAEHCYNGFYFLNTGEYSQITNCNSLSCVIGIQIRSGNIAVSNSQFTNNRIGGFVGNGSNNGHGSFTGCFFNHNKLRSVLAHGLTSGHVFSGCHAFDGDMEIWNSKGFNWSGGEIACGVIHTSQASARNQISSTVFLKSYNGGTITATGAGSLGLKNNFFIDGSDSTAINN